MGDKFSKNQHEIFLVQETRIVQDIIKFSVQVLKIRKFLKI